MRRQAVRRIGQLPHRAGSREASALTPLLVHRLRSAVQHLACAVGALVATLVVHERPDHSLENMPGVGVFAIACTLVVPSLTAVVERRVRAREAGDAAKL